MSSAAAIPQAQSVEDFADAGAAFRDRYAFLRTRAGIVGVSGIIGWIVALVGMLIFGNPLAEGFVYSPSSSGGVDIPAILFQVSASEANGLALLFAFAAVGLIGIASNLKRGLRPWEMVAWVLILALLGGRVLHSHSRFFVMADEQAAAQQLVRAAHEGDLSKAIALLPMESRPMESQYVLAQMALTDGDEKVLKTYAEPLLRKLDRLLLRMDGGDETSTASLPDLRIDVLQRLDLGLYGAPHSQVSFAVATPLASSAVPGEQWFVADLAGVAGALFLAWLSTGALVLCHRMSQRSLRLRAWLGIA